MLNGAQEALQERNVILQRPLQLITGGSDELKREPWQASFRPRNVSKAGKREGKVSVNGPRSLSHEKETSGHRLHSDVL